MINMASAVLEHSGTWDNEELTPKQFFLLGEIAKGVYNGEIGLDDDEECPVAPI
jgi:hypothetical protein